MAEPKQNGIAIKTFRELRGLNRQDLANLLSRTSSVSYPHLANVENEHKSSTPTLLCHIADVLDIPVEAIDRSSESEPKQNGIAIKTFRELRYLGRQELADQLSQISPVSYSHLANIENEFRDATPALLHRIANVLDIPAAAIARRPIYAENESVA